MTIIGQHTVAETRELIRAIEFRVGKVTQQWQKVQNFRLRPPTAAQLAEWDALDGDMKKFLTRWTNARDRETLKLTAIKIAAPLVPAETLPSESSFVAINEASIREHPRLGEMQNRVETEAAMLGLPPIDLSGTPAQNSADVDFAAMQKLDKAIGSAGNPLGKPGGTDSVAKSPLGLILIGAAVLTVIGGGLYVKTALRL